MKVEDEKQEDALTHNALFSPDAISQESLSAFLCCRRPKREGAKVIIVIKPTFRFTREREILDRTAAAAMVKGKKSRSKG